MDHSTDNLKTQSKTEQNRGGRPIGTRSTESSTLVARVRAVLRQPQEDFARRIGVRERTVRNYESNSIIPKAGLVRAAVEQLARDNGIALQEESEENEAGLS